MLLRSFLGVVLCELTACYFIFLSLSTPYVAAAVVPRPVLSEPKDPRNATAAAQEYTPRFEPLGLQPRDAEVFIRSDTGTFVRTREAPSQYPSPSTAVKSLVARQATTVDSSLPSDTPTSAVKQTTSFSQPVANPSATFSDPFPPEPLPTQDIEPIPPAPSVPETQTGVPTWAWGLGGAGIGLTVLFGLTRLLVFCSRKPQSE